MSLSEIRVNTTKTRTGVGTITYTETGPVITGIATASNFKTGSTNVHSTGVELTNINTGGATATFGGAISGTTASFSGTVSIGGTLTYEDVTNIDSVGILTARAGIIDSTLTAGRVVYVDSDKSLTNSANLTFDGSIADLTGKLRIDIATGGTVGSGNAEGIFLRNTQETDNNAVTIFGGADDYNTAASAINFVNVDHSANYGDISFDTRGSGGYGERLRIKSTGQISAGGGGTAWGNALLSLITPSGRSTAFDASDGDTWHDMVIKNTSAATNNAVGLAFQVTGTGYHKNAGTGIAAVKNGTNSDYGADMVFVTRPQSAVAAERLRITSAGDVCINRTGAIEDAKLSIQCDATQAAIGIQCNHTNTDTDLITAFNSSGKNIVNITAETDNSPYLKFEILSGNTAVERFRVNHLGNVSIGGGIAPNRLEIINDHKGFPSDSDQPNATLLIKHGTSGSNRRWVGIGASLTGAWIQSSSPGNTGLAAPLYINKGGGDVTLGNDRVVILSGGTVNIGANLTQTTYPFSVQKDLNSGGNLAYFANSDSTYSQGLTLSFDSNKDIKWAGGSGAGGMIWDMGTRGFKWRVGGNDRARLDQYAYLILDSQSQSGNSKPGIELKSTGYTGNITRLFQDSPNAISTLETTERSLLLDIDSGNQVAGSCLAVEIDGTEEFRFNPGHFEFKNSSNNSKGTLLGGIVYYSNTNLYVDLTQWTMGTNWNVLEVFGYVNPNSAGSGQYTDPVHMYIYRGIGWANGGIKNFVYSVSVAPPARQAFQGGSGMSGNSGISAVWCNSGTVVGNETATSTHYVRLVIPNANASHNFQKTFRILRRY